MPLIVYPLVAPGPVPTRPFLLCIQSVTQAGSSDVLVFLRRRSAPTRNSRRLLSASTLIISRRNITRTRSTTLVRKRTSRVNLLLVDGATHPPILPSPSPLQSVGLGKPLTSKLRASLVALDGASKKKGARKHAQVLIFPDGAGPVLINQFCSYLSHRWPSPPTFSRYSGSSQSLPVIQRLSLPDNDNNLLNQLPLPLVFPPHARGKPRGKLSAPLDTWSYPFIAKVFSELFLLGGYQG